MRPSLPRDRTLAPLVSSPIARAILVVGWGAVAVLTAASIAGLEPSGVWLYLPFALSVVAFGLPHGAVDHLVLLRLDGAPFRPRPLLRALATYLSIGLAYLAVWFLAPVAAFVSFIALTWFHWGQGDVHSLLALTGGRHLQTRGQRILALVVRGGMPMLVPLLAFPEVYLDVARSVVGVLGVDGALEGLPSPTVRMTVAVVFAALGGAHLAAGWRARPPNARTDWRIDAAETVGLALFFATVHPLLAIGVYFCLWHSTRHIIRLAATTDKPPPPLPAHRPWWTFAVHAAPMTALALVFLGGLYALVPVTPASPDRLVGLYLVLIAVLTLPHVWVVARMDRAEAVWTPELNRPAPR